MSESTKAVFLSYASQDAETVERICDALRAAGLEVWFDRNELRGGDAWDASIRKQIKECALFVPVISTNTNARSEGYFRLEWKLAIDRSHLMADDQAFLLPVVIDDTPEAMARVPDRFRERQWSRLAGDETLAVFAENVKRLLSGGAAPAIAMFNAKPVRRSRVLIVTLIIVAAGTVAGFYIFSHRSSSKAPPSSTASTPAVILEKSIAVLPFVNMSEDKSNEYFSDGISEELSNLLGKVPQLQVTARTSSFAFKGKEIGVPEIARTLHVAHVLEGSVRKAGNSVRITAQLIKAGTDTHLWSQTYDRKLDDVFAIQDEIAADVVKQLKVTLLGTAPKVRTTDPEAYALYLQAVQLGWQNTAEAFQQSDALLRKVLAIDPRYAPAWDGLATNFARETTIGLLSNKEGYAQAREANMKALALDPDYARGHAGLGWFAMYGDNDLAGAAQHFQRALALDPADLDVLRNSGNLLQSLGRLDEALALEEALVRRDPVNVTALSNLGNYQRMAGKFDAAIASYRTALSLAPGRGTAHANLGIALMLKGDPQGALAEVEQEKSENWKMIGLPMAYHALGRQADSDAALAALIAKYEKDAPYNIASIYAYRGEADQAFAWLDKAVEYGDGGLGDIVTDNLFDKIHGDPRWLAFLRKVGKAPEQLAKIEFKVTPPQ